ncbi:MAG: ABC transporter ATP-binding protein [Paracoccus sp. (in: a-proteobacteria)]|uniref:ABC transporter ATP-binding protein n=1 Tax=unclassified Paracoccus (in: a-proteobacteria) TaxID=2688777 RepID=UPI000C5E83A2|nr:MULTISPECIES: ABC transporter ATP-binding protein [unclassified Paracoccus (in: a-proteobacteria)]MAN55859.1 spermidine/putrescine ABC transporter ATP-binding protein [Paracoccus sp. (in: a-proteobacteria)]MBA49864.1 spermidine/putrescine ABC transporter ATP-binding protein [Paracoccus sp. (in: a-proteobacteria)]MCS5602704.1 ABC transporter ATP-binding protein [Paracoccus sp. (in: a-proteobacteria)]MDB2551088.1 ABC transporter ATP-binding protein [Paracoccus sp. (in: a-proteobacteria)]
MLDNRAGDAFVAFEHVQKSYDGQTLVVKDLNLSIGRGEFLTMLGPSGSGKTTCLMMLAGFETATHGEIRLAGRPINQVPPHKRGIGMVFQNYALFPHMTVGENLSFPLEVRGMDKAERDTRIRRALDMVQMGSFANRRPAQLSGGQQQRIALARALVFDPELVLMDEPLGALDKQLREHMQFEIKHLHEELGITVVYVTHDQGEALTMSDRIAVFNDGRIQQLATPSELYERPENSFVAGFIGENNALPGTIEKLDGDKALVRLDSGDLIDATAVNIRESGQRTTVSIRPERVEFKSELMPEGAHTVEADVAEVIYMGDILRTRLRVADSDNFVMKFRNTAGQTRLQPGQKIRIGWHPQDARALDPV